MNFVKTGCKLNFLTYHGIINSIKNGAKRIEFNLNDLQFEQLPKLPMLHSILSPGKKGCKLFYKILRSQSILHNSNAKEERKWVNEIGLFSGIHEWDKRRQLFSSINHCNNLKW